MRWIAVFLTALTAPLAAAEDVVIVCPVTGMIDEGIAVIIERAVEEANERNAKALIFRVDTPGGRVDSAIKIANSIQSASCQTISFIEGMGAISAGALISFACNDIIMTPGSNMGAATPVIAGPQGTQPTGEKEVSFMRAKMRALAESRGHNPHIAQAMVDKDIELRGYTNEAGEYVIYSRTHEGDQVEPAEDTGQGDDQPQSPLDELLPTSPGALIAQVIPGRGDPSESSEQPTQRGEIILPKGKLLTLTPSEAAEYGVIPKVVDNLDAALEFYGLGSFPTEEISPTWAESLFRWLTSPTVAGLLLLLGMAGLYFEVQSPGIGLPGIVGAVCLALFFGSHFILGLADIVDILLVATGVGLILVEMFLIPGFGIAGFAGVFCLLVGLYLSFVDFTFPEYSWQWDRMGEVGYSMTIAFVSFIGFMILSWKLLPRTPFYGQLILAGAQQTDQGYVIEPDEDAKVGMTGTALSMLRPAGRGRFEGNTLMVVTRGDFIEKGAPIEIVDVQGNRYVVERAHGETQ